METKKVVSAMMAFTVAAGFAAGTMADAAAINFKDVTTHWAKPAITQAVNDGYVKGYSDGTFKPSGNVTRAEFASIVVRAFDLPKDSGYSPSFKDLKTSHWGYEAITNAVSMGVINPESYYGTFAPNEAMSRVEISEWITNALVRSGKGYDQALRDLDKTIIPVVEYYKGDIAKFHNGMVGLMVGTGIMGGDNNGKFNPDNNVTRAEMVSILYRYLDVAKKDPKSFSGLNEMREVGTTGTNMTSIAKVTWIKDQNGKELKLTDIMGKELAAKNGSGIVKLNNFIVIDTHNKTPKSIYAKMFQNDITSKKVDFVAFSDITFKASKQINSSALIANAQPGMTGTGTASPTLTRYGVQVMPIDFSNTAVLNALAPGKSMRGWVNPILSDWVTEFGSGNISAGFKLER